MVKNKKGGYFNSAFLVIILGICGIAIPILGALFNANQSQLNYLDPITLIFAIATIILGFKLRSSRVAVAGIVLGFIALLLFLLSVMDFTVL